MGLYKPGENILLPVKQLFATTGTQRQLQADEFLYYLSFLFQETMALAIKGAIAVVLKADLIKLYGGSYEMFVDKDIEYWVSYYRTLSGFSKQLANSEIRHFENFLKEPKIDIEAYYPGSVDEIIYELAINNKQAQDYLSVVVWKNEKTYIDEFWKTKTIALEEEKKTKELTNHLINADPGIAARKDKWIGQNLVAYMAGYFVRHPISLIADSKKSSWEFKVREDMLKAARTGLMSATDALAYYITALDLIAGIDNETEFLLKLYELEKPLPEHPMVKVMYQHIGLT